MLTEQYKEVIESLEQKGMMYEASVIQSMVGELLAVNRVMKANIKAASEILEKDEVSAETLKEIHESEQALEIQSLTR